VPSPGPTGHGQKIHRNSGNQPNVRGTFQDLPNLVQFQAPQWEIEKSYADQYPKPESPVLHERVADRLRSNRDDCLPGESFEKGERRWAFYHRNQGPRPLGEMRSRWGRPTMKRDLLIATTNRGKLREYRGLLSGVPARLLTLGQLRLSLEVPEDGESYEENAVQKALAFASASGRLTLADDTGLEVELLGGNPGLRSARYVGPNADDAVRRRYLLERLTPFPRPWIARFVCVIAVVEPGGHPATASGTCWGEIVPVPRGTSGFGYDPIFQIREGNRTYAQLSLREKNQISHRAKAFGGLLPALRALLPEKNGHSA